MLSIGLRSSCTTTSYVLKEVAENVICRTVVRVPRGMIADAPLSSVWVLCITGMGLYNYLNFFQIFGNALNTPRAFGRLEEICLTGQARMYFGVVAGVVQSSLCVH